MFKIVLDISDLADYIPIDECKISLGVVNLERIKRAYIRACFKDSITFLELTLDDSDMFRIRFRDKKRKLLSMCAFPAEKELLEELWALDDDGAENEEYLQFLDLVMINIIHFLFNNPFHKMEH